MLRTTTLLLILAAAAPAAGVQLTLENVTARAVAHNPALAAARARVDEARGRLRQAGRLRNPELDLEYSQNVRSPENRFAASLMQQFPLTRRLALERITSQAELAAVEAEVRNEERKVAGEARTAFVKLLALRGQRALREKQLGNSRLLSDFTRKRVSSGEASVVHATEAELAVEQLSADILQLEAEQAILLGELRPLIGASPRDTIEVSGALPGMTQLPRSEVELALRADFKAAGHRTVAARHAAALARAERLEDVGLGFSAERDYAEDAPDGLERDVMAGVRVSIPLPFWNRNQGRIQETAASMRRARLEQDALAITIRAEAAAAREQVRLLGELVQSLSDLLLPKAAQVEDQLRNAYSTGQATLTEVLAARDKLLFLERQRLDALRDYHLARTRYAIVTGRIVSATATKRSGK